MYAQVFKLENFRYNDHEFDILWLILDRYNSPPLLPLLFTTYLCRYGITYRVHEQTDITNRTRTSTLTSHDIEPPTIRKYNYCLSNFLSYLDECKEYKGTPGIHSSMSCSQFFVRHYLNNVLLEKLGSSQSLESNQAALQAYYNWLEYMNICPTLDLKIYRKTRQQMAEKCEKQHYIQYVSRYWRTQLLNHCVTLAEKLIIRMGFEVGLRTSELTGLRISGQNRLTTLFRQLDNAEYNNVDKFRYRLPGRYTKSQKSRWIYFSRQLLLDMKRYFLIYQADIRERNSKILFFCPHLLPPQMLSETTWNFDFW